MDDLGAFVPGPRVRIEGNAGGPLSGLSFAAKDLFDVAGLPTGGGNHDWPTGRPVPERHAWAVQTLLDAGTTLIGKTITDEVSLGILGENAFGCPAALRPARRRPSRRACAIPRSALILVARCVCRRVSAASMASGPPTVGSMSRA